jgi:hypothetical protein
LTGEWDAKIVHFIIGGIKNINPALRSRRSLRMTKQEFATFAMALKTFYPRETLLPNEQAMELWFRQLNDIPYEVAEAGLMKWVSINKWSPSIADIREISAEIIHGEMSDWGEEWEKVIKAIRMFGHTRPKDALDSLPPLTRQAVKRIGFINICLSENLSADRANFRMIYEELVQREKKQAQMPETLKASISQIQMGMLEDKGGGE